MKIFLIGPGCKPIPPKGWGAIESLIWDYYENLKKYEDIQVEIINNQNLSEVVHYCNEEGPDIIHIMYDDYVILAPHLKCTQIYYTSHYAYITHPEFQEKFNNYFENIFRKVIELQEYITINSISPKISDIYRRFGFKGKINDICNGAREDLFIYTNEPKYPAKTIYVAKIENRKSQYKYQSLPNIVFVGNYYDSSFDVINPNYLGEWDKETLYKNLTHYGNLVLLSEGEADPLVVKEALITGLGVVVSECSSANLDLTKDFITVIPNDKLTDLRYIAMNIIKNRIYSITHREEIREYALKNFAWNSIVNNYKELLVSRKP